LQAETDLCIGDNEPYSGHLPGDAIDRHALRLGRHNTLIELQERPDRRHRLAAGHWAARLAPILTEVLEGL
jgi:predicted N-formylglutamate amidohydrolase